MNRHANTQPNNPSTKINAGFGFETLWRTVRPFSDNSSTIITTDSKGQRLVKTFSNNMRNMVAVLTDASNKELARLTKVFSEDGKSITSTVVYGE